MRHAFIGGVLTIAFAAASPAQAQLSTGPMQVMADALDFPIAPECVTSYDGRVEILQNDVRLRADSVRSYHRRNGDRCGSTLRLEATGGVFYITPEQSIRANRAEYNLETDVAVFTGDVIAVRGEDVSTADRMEINLETNAVRMSGNVRGVVFPDESETP
jgi:lipopolysaccharide export system protein LptA